MSFEGHWDNFNYDSSELKKKSELVENRRGELFYKEEKSTVEGSEPVRKIFYRYMFAVPINHGICSDNQILPAGVHVRMSFHRAKARKSVIDISDTPTTFPTNAVKLLEPSLQVCWTYSSKLKSQMGQISNSGISIPYESSHIRHRVLDNGLSDFSVQIMQGPMPEYIVFFFQEPERFENSLLLSSSKLSRHGLEQFSLVLDNTVCEHYPLKVHKYGNSTFFHEFYKRFLIMCSNYGDSYEQILPEKTFLETNFMIIENFGDFEHKEGNLMVHLKFDHLLTEKLYFAWMPVTKKNIKFDRNLSVQIN
jgi:hypothetical protein